MTDKFLKYTHPRACVRYINKGVTLSPRHPIQPDDIKRRNERRRKPAFNAGEWTYGKDGT